MISTLKLFDVTVETLELRAGLWRGAVSEEAGWARAGEWVLT